MPEVSALLDDQQLAERYSPARREDRWRRQPRRRSSPSGDGRRLISWARRTREQLRGTNFACFRGHVWSGVYIDRLIPVTCPDCGANSPSYLATDRWTRIFGRMERDEYARRVRARSNVVSTVRSRYYREHGRSMPTEDYLNLMRRITLPTLEQANAYHSAGTDERNRIIEEWAGV